MAQPLDVTPDPGTSRPVRHSQPPDGTGWTNSEASTIRWDRVGRLDELYT
jgi:hypothetical protein